MTKTSEKKPDIGREAESTIEFALQNAYRERRIDPRRHNSKDVASFAYILDAVREKRSRERQDRRRKG